MISQVIVSRRHPRKTKGKGKEHTATKWSTYSLTDANTTRDVALNTQTESIQVFSWLITVSAINKRLLPARRRRRESLGLISFTTISIKGGLENNMIWDAYPRKSPTERYLHRI